MFQTKAHWMEENEEWSIYFEKMRKFEGEGIRSGRVG